MVIQSVVVYYILNPKKRKLVTRNNSINEINYNYIPMKYSNHVDEVVVRSPRK